MNHIDKIYAIGATFKYDADVYLMVERGPSCMGCYFYGKSCDAHEMSCTTAFRGSRGIKYIEVSKEYHESNTLKDSTYNRKGGI